LKTKKKKNKKKNDVPDLQDFEYVDLTGRGLRTIPVALHKKADMLVTLTLSRNPMLEIPLDFIQACTTLRDLRLSHMAMKKVPHSVRYSVTLYQLDISCNRIADLGTGLDRIPELRSLKAQNNRMEKLPWYFPRLRALKYLNISNNKFKQLPSVVTEMTSLVDLDFSFNMISELPPEIGRLTALERLIIVGNQVSDLPSECTSLVSLKVLDCRRNNLSHLSVACMLPQLETLRADHNSAHALDLSLGLCLKTVDASHNDITQLTLLPPPASHVSYVGLRSYALRSLDISHAKLSSLDSLDFSQLASLEFFRMDHNSIRFIPESLGELSQLILFSCSDNELAALPASIGRLQRLETLEAHKNSLKELPPSLWNCASLSHINATSNLIERWPPALAPAPSIVSSSSSGKATPDSMMTMVGERKASIASVHGSWDANRGGWGRYLPPLAHSLERLSLGENQFTDDSIHPLIVLKELVVLNLSFNELQDIPPHFFRRMTQLEELYLSGNKLTTVPTEDLNRLTKLSVLFLNGNRLQTLPRELSLLQNLAVLDVGSNILRYNINNTEFDWNW
jgi:adenylate cyclase